MQWGWMSVAGLKSGVGLAALGGGVLIASVALNTLALVMPLVILLVFDRVIPNHSLDTLHVLSVMLVVVVLMELILRRARSVLLGWSAARAARSGQRRFVDKVLSANTRDFAREEAAVYLQRFAALARIRDHNAGDGQTLAVDMPFTLLFMAMIALIGGALVLVPLVTLLLLVAYSVSMRRVQRHLFDRRKTLDARRYAFLSEVIGQILTVKSNSMERQMTRRFEALQDQSAQTSERLIGFSGFTQSYGAVIAQLSVAAMGLLGAKLVIDGQIGLAELAACMLLNGRVTQPLTRMMGYRVQLESVETAKSTLAEMETLRTARISPPRAPMAGRIEAVRLSLDLPSEDARAFDGLTGCVAPGQTALVEATDGAAVQALFDALTGQVQPVRGNILIDGLMPVDRVAQRGEGGLVVLETAPAILTASLLENLSAFGDAARIDRAKLFAARLGLEQRIHRLPLGYNTQLGGGSVFEQDPVNRQLIALTRVLALQPRVLLMQEPSSVLQDPERRNLRDCLAGLDEPRPTILVASQDPKIRGLADTVLSLQSDGDWDMASRLEQEEWDRVADASAMGSAA